MNPKRTGASHVVPPDVNLGNISPGHRTAVPAPRAEPVPPNTALLGLRPPTARSSALDLSALREAQNYVRDLGIRFHQTGNRWVATNGVDPDDAGQSDACVELEVVSDASARRVETDAGIQSVAPIEIWHIQRGDAPPGTAHRLLAALLWHARIVPTKIFGVIQESTTRRLMQATPEDFAAKIENSLIVRMRAKALLCVGLRPAQTAMEHDARGVVVLATHVDPFSIRRRLTAEMPK